MRDALHQVAVAADHVDVEVEELEARAVEVRGLPLARRSPSRPRSRRPGRAGRWSSRRPEVQRYSGWPAAFESSWRNDLMSSRVTDWRAHDLVVGVDRPHPGRGEAASRAASRRARPRARSGRGWARSARRGRSAGSAARACRRPGPAPSASPGGPEFAFWIASIESVRIVLIAELVDLVEGLARRRPSTRSLTTLATSDRRCRVTDEPRSGSPPRRRPSWSPTGCGSASAPARPSPTCCRRWPRAGSTDPLRRHLGRDRGAGARARAPGRAVRVARPARHRDRRRRPGRPRRLAGQGRRRRPHAREDRRRGRRALRRHRRLVEAGRRDRARRSRSSCTASASPRRLRELGEAVLREGAARSPDGGVIADYLGEVGDPIRARRRGSRPTPGVVDHGLFPPALVADVIVARGDEVERIALAALAGRRQRSAIERSPSTAATAPGGDRRVAGAQLRQRLALVGAGDQPEDPPRRVERRVGERHPAAALVLAGQRDAAVA